MTSVEERLGTTQAFELIRRLSAPVPQRGRSQLSVKDLASGGFLRIISRDELFPDGIYAVLSQGLYRETNEDGKKLLSWKATELEIVRVLSGHNLWLEWEEDDAVEMSITFQEVPFGEIRGDDGEYLEDPDDYTGRGDHLTYGGVNYRYNDDYAVRYIRDGRKSEWCFVYEFAANNGHCLTIEEWTEEGGGEEYKCYLSRRLEASELEVIQKKGENG
jgi:hypothetical protein